LRKSKEGSEANPGSMPEEKLKQLEFFIDNISDAVYWTTSDGRFLNVNAAACTMLGYSREELLSMSVRDINLTYYPADAQPGFVKIKQTSNIQCAEFHNTRAGVVTPVEITSNCFAYNGVEYVCAAARDISGRKRMEDELRHPHDEQEKRVEERTLALQNTNELLQHEINERKKSEQVLRQLNLVLENSPVVLFRCKASCDWPVELVSGNVIRFGYTPEEFLSGAITYSSIIHPQDLEKVISEMEKYTASADVQLLQEYRIITKGGDIRWIFDQTVSERNEAGEITHYQGVIFDVTDRKRAEESLRKSEERLKQQKKMLEELNSTLEKRVQEEVTKNREKDIALIQQNRQATLGEMLDHIAHQWKQPLNSIALIVQYLKESWSCGELTDEDVEESVGKTMALVEHMAQTIDVFRSFYRPEKEQAVYRLKDSIDSALSFMAPALRFHGIEVEIDADPGVSAIGYPNEYAQVLLNILTNARDTFKERNVDNPMLKLEAFSENDKAVVAITDNAGGIPESIIGKIFDLFFTTRGTKDGTGIGLYMSKNIIEKNMRGKLSAANVDGGAQFRIELNMPG
jgi:PAS domain S-box-containing protein